MVRSAAIVGSANVLFVLAWLVTQGRLKWLVIGEDNRYSGSKFQMVLWFWTFLTLYLAAFALRLWNGGAIDRLRAPSELLLLSGMSAATFAGAKQIVVSKGISTHASAASRKLPPRAGPRFPHDLVTDDSGVRPDVGDTQMLVLTTLTAVLYSVRVFYWLGQLPLGPADLPPVDTARLGALGVGQGAYLAKKFAGDSGATASAGPILTVPPPPSL